jgi:DNA-binding NtrC family response regulator
VVVAVILIVEDDVFVRDIAELMVEECGHIALSAGDVGEALLLLHSPQHIDALFTDIRLKSAVLGGFELAHEAIKLRPRLRVLYATGSFETEKMTALFVKGALFLEKPYTQQQLKSSVEEMFSVPFEVA